MTEVQTAPPQVEPILDRLQASVTLLQRCLAMINRLEGGDAGEAQAQDCSLFGLANQIRELAGEVNKRLQVYVG